MFKVTSIKELEYDDKALGGKAYRLVTVIDKKSGREVVSIQFNETRSAVQAALSFYFDGQFHRVRVSTGSAYNVNLTTYATEKLFNKAIEFSGGYIGGSRQDTEDIAIALAKYITGKRAFFVSDTRLD